MIIKEFKKFEKAGNIVLGFPGAGMVGSIASEFVIHKLGFEEVGHIRSEKLPALAIIRKSRPESPIRIYKKGSNVILVSDVMIPDNLAHDFASELAKWIKSKKPKEVIILGGSKKSEDGEKVYVVSWKSSYLDDVKLDHLKLGFVVGIYGPLMMELREMGQSGYLVLAEAEQKPDPSAAARVIRHLSERIGIKVDPSALEKEGARQEKIGAKTWDPYPSIYG